MSAKQHEDELLAKKRQQRRAGTSLKVPGYDVEFYENLSTLEGVFVVFPDGLW